MTAAVKCSAPPTTSGFAWFSRLDFEQGCWAPNAAAASDAGIRT